MMATYNVPSERTDLAVRAGHKLYLENPLNQGDAIGITLNWAALLGSETISSAVWASDNGVAVSSKSVSSPSTLAVLTAASGASGNRTVECTITGSGDTIRTVAVVVEVVNLR